MGNFSDWVMGTHDFPARWGCGNWTQPHGWTHIISDILVWGAYLTIPVMLIYFISKRKDMPFPKIFWLFGLFIFFCGTGHLLEAIIYWVPIYRVAALNKFCTAAVSWATVAALVPVIPMALSFKSPSELQVEVDRRIKAEEELKEKADELESINKDLQERQSVLEKRTKELDRMNQLMVGRETRMVELKATVKKLQEQIASKEK